METDKVAIGFSNCLGNFILMTSVLKILRKKYQVIDLITDKARLKSSPAVQDLAYKLFDNVVTEYSPDNYSKVFVGNWSVPFCFEKKTKSLYWSGSTPYNGLHEVQVYLDMIEATYKDFDGLLMPVDIHIKLDKSSTRVALSNSSEENGSRRGYATQWPSFPELSECLEALGYDVILVGQGTELEGCVGHNFINKLDIFETAGVISQCDVMITTDSGLMHVADALGVPIVLLSGPTPLTKSHPIVSKYCVVRKYVSCAPCFQGFLKLCKNNICMKMIEVEDVLPKIIEV